MGRAYEQLSLEERIEVQVERERGLSTRAIARVLRRAASTVSREIRRNGSARTPRTERVGRPPQPTPYNAAEAQQRAVRLAGKPHVERKLVVGTAAWVAVLEQCAAGLSPEQAARTLKRMHPENPDLHFSHETIYQAIYARMKGTGAEAALQGFSSVLARIEAQHRLSMTYDQGKEMTRHQELIRNTGVQVYFADPHSPWQRGINENTNGLLRQYLPKGEDLSRHSQNDLDAIAWALNTRPRKSLGWKCTAEVFLPNFDFVKYWHRTFNHVALQT